MFLLFLLSLTYNVKAQHDSIKTGLEKAKHDAKVKENAAKADVYIMKNKTTITPKQMETATRSNNKNHTKSKTIKKKIKK